MSAKPIEPVVIDDTPKMSRARQLLGARLTERGQLGYFLDGRPTNVLAILRAAGL